mmetsp:Transcript_104805/g.320999  ORF Transcript_104805/g.320999 Transcript_104805/m.320999 type:complete len:270 (+) Transcript_104805:596-1405(+)
MYSVTKHGFGHSKHAPMKPTKRLWRKYRNDSISLARSCITSSFIMESSPYNILIATSLPLYVPRYTSPNSPEPRLSTWVRSEYLIFSGSVSSLSSASRGVERRCCACAATTWAAPASNGVAGDGATATGDIPGDARPRACAASRIGDTAPARGGTACGDAAVIGGASWDVMTTRAGAGWYCAGGDGLLAASPNPTGENAWANGGAAGVKAPEGKASAGPAATAVPAQAAAVGDGWKDCTTRGAGLAYREYAVVAMGTSWPGEVGGGRKD